MAFPVQRLRRLRVNEKIRRLVQETTVEIEDLVYPLFVAHGQGLKKSVESMPGVYNLSIDTLLEEAAEIIELGIPGVILFGLPAYKDEMGSEAYDDEGIVQQAVRALKQHFPNLLVITDVCLCEYTSHGHCGVVKDGRILNDPTLELLSRTPLSHARAGADIVAPSDMMDGRVAAIRQALDEAGFQDGVGSNNYRQQFGEGPEFMRSDFRFFHQLRVRYSEIDAQGIVFNAHYLTYMDVAITEYFRHLGLEYKQLAQEGKMDMALVKTCLEFKTPAFFDDILEIGVRVSHIGNKSYTVDFEIYKKDSDVLVLKGQTVYVNYNPTTRTAEPVPDFFRTAIEKFECLTTKQ